VDGEVLFSSGSFSPNFARSFCDGFSINNKVVG
jgi:hypothetical protein